MPPTPPSAPLWSKWIRPCTNGRFTLGLKIAKVPDLYSLWAYKARIVDCMQAWMRGYSSYWQKKQQKKIGALVANDNGLADLEHKLGSSEDGVQPALLMEEETLALRGHST